MALYTVSDVIEATKRLIEEAGDIHVVTQNQLIQMTLDSERKVASETQCLTDTDTVSLSSSGVSYDPPSGASSIVDIVYYYPNGMKSLRRIEPGHVPATADQLYPYFWYYRASKVWMFPWLSSVPSDSGHDEDKVTVIYAKLPTTTAELTSDLTIPDDFQIIVPYLVAKLVAIKDNQMAKVQELDKIILGLAMKGSTQISQQGAYTPVSE